MDKTFKHEEAKEIRIFNIPIWRWGYITKTWPHADVGGEILKQVLKAEETKGKNDNLDKP